MNAPVAVGYDGSADSRVAVDFAVAEAETRRRPLLILHAANIPMATMPPEATLPWGEGGSARGVLQNMLADLASEIADVAPHVPVSTELIMGSSIGRCLVEKSRDCHLMVVGSRGRGGFAGLLLGSTSSQLASHAHCPVIVTRHNAATVDGSIVVGVDGSAVSSSAIEFAFEEASLRKVPLIAVHAWQHPISGGAGDMVPLVYEHEQLAEIERRVLTDALAGWQEKYPDVAVTPLSVNGRTRQMLLDQAEEAALLVVGSRGRGGFTGMLLGSTSQAVLHHATVPVAVVGSKV